MPAVKKTSAPSGPKAKVAAKPKGIGLHLGLNAVDPQHYGGWSGPLAACENDARDMAAIAAKAAMKSTVLLTAQATTAALLKGLRSAAKSLVAGDFFFLTYSGHGGQVKDLDGDESDKKDETWCLFDRQLIDDELYYELSRFNPGVRIVMLSDSCHSGSVARAKPPAVPKGKRSKLMPPDIAEQVYAAHAREYDKIQRDVAKKAGGQVVDPDAALAAVAGQSAVAPLAVASAFKASLVLISGCQDNQTSMDGARNGAFTEALLKVWSNGAYVGTYADLHKRVKARLPATQTPNLFTLGPATAVGRFLAQAPFKL